MPATSSGEVLPKLYTPFSTQMPRAHSASSTATSVMGWYVRTALTPALASSSASCSTTSAKFRPSGCRPPFFTGFHATPFKCSGLPSTRTCRPRTSIFFPSPPPAEPTGAGAVVAAAGESSAGGMVVSSWEGAGVVSGLPVVSDPEAGAVVAAVGESSAGGMVVSSWEGADVVSGPPVVSDPEAGQEPADCGSSQVQSMSEVPGISASQSTAYFTLQSSFTSSAAPTHTWPKLSQYLSHRPP